MIVIEAINKAIRDSVNLITGIAEFAIVAEADSEADPRPASPYCSVNFVTSTTQSLEELSYENSGEDLQITHSDNQSLMFSIIFYKSGANDNANKVRLGFARESIKSLMTSQKLGILGRSPVRKISVPIEGTWEERSQFDIVINAVGTDQEIVTAIQAVNMELTSQFNGNNYTQTIEVD